MESNRPWIIAIIFLAVTFMFFMFSIKGLRFEKVVVEKETLPEVHFIWDWNKAADWFHGLRPAKLEERKLEEEKALKESQQGVK